LQIKGIRHRIQQVDVQTGTVVKSFGKLGKAKGEVSYPVLWCLLG